MFREHYIKNQSIKKYKTVIYNTVKTFKCKELKKTVVYFFEGETINFKFTESKWKHVQICQVDKYINVSVYVFCIVFYFINAHCKWSHLHDYFVKQNKK